MKKHTSSRSSLLLMEIIIAILFFSVVSAICLQLFVKADHLGKDTEELDMAVRQASSVAEIVSQSVWPLEQLRKVYKDFDVGNDGGSIYFNKDFQPCAEEDARYRLEISLSSLGDRMDSYSIKVYGNSRQDAIYSLDVASYRQYLP